MVRHDRRRSAKVTKPPVTAKLPPAGPVAPNAAAARKVCREEAPGTSRWGSAQGSTPNALTSVHWPAPTLASISGLMTERARRIQERANIPPTDAEPRPLLAIDRRSVGFPQVAS